MFRLPTLALSKSGQTNFVKKLVLGSKVLPSSQPVTQAPLNIQLLMRTIACFLQVVNDVGGLLFPHDDQAAGKHRDFAFAACKLIADTDRIRFLQRGIFELIFQPADRHFMR